MTISDSAGVEIVDHPAPAVEATTAGQPAVVIAGPSGGEFGQVWDVTIDPGPGRLFVVDATQRAVFVFDLDGRFVQQIGRDGEGPGEFRLPARAVIASDTLFVWDPALRRLTAFSLEGRLARDTVLDTVQGIGALAWASPTGLIGQIGPIWASPPRDNGLVRLARLEAPESPPVGVTWDESSANVALIAPGQSSVAAIPFAPRHSWALDPDGTLLLTTGRRFEIRRYALDGSLRQIVRRESRAAAVTPWERDSATRALGDLPPALREGIEIPATKPAIERLFVDTDRSLWVVANAADASPDLELIRLTPEGRLSCRIRLPQPRRIVAINGGLLAGVDRDSLGADNLKLVDLASIDPSCRPARQPDAQPARSNR